MGNTKAPTYDVYEEFDGHLTDQASTSSAVVLAIYRLKDPISFDRSKMASTNKMVTEGAELRGKNPLIIVSDCRSLSVTSSKGNHLHSLQAMLRQGKRNYLNEILTGDWIMAWMVSDVEKAREVVDVLRNNNSSEKKTANDFHSGLKFVGRVQSIGKNVRQSPDGKRKLEIPLTAIGFKELDTSVVYLLDLAEVAYNNITTWMAKIGIDIRELFVKNKSDLDGSKQLGNNSEKIIVSMIEILLGQGSKRGDVGLNVAGSKGLTTAYGGSVTEGPQELGEATESSARQAAPFAYLVPAAVANVLGSSNGKDVASYTAIMEVLTGRQTFSNENADEPHMRFQPDIRVVEGFRKSTDDELLGTYLPFPASFVNTPLWQILTQFLNTTVNEMYTAIRVNDEGRIVPTLVVRQIPFTTEAFKDSEKDKNGKERVTRFMNLPRWIIRPQSVVDVGLVRSDATRVNFVHIGVLDDNQAGFTVSEQLAVNKPVFDSLDIQRSGIYPYITTLCAAPRDQAGKAPRFWMELVADHRIGSHLTMSGVLTCHGIQAPICIGDNVQFDDLVLHIETVTHTYNISPDGHKSFMTSLSLTNGLHYEVPNRGRGTLIPDTDQNSAPMYPGMFSLDETQFDPGFTAEGIDEEPDEDEYEDPFSDDPDTDWRTD